MPTCASFFELKAVMGINYMLTLWWVGAVSAFPTKSDIGCQAYATPAQWCDRSGRDLASLFSPTTIGWTNCIRGLGISLNPEAARVPVGSVFPGVDNHPDDVRPDN